MHGFNRCPMGDSGTDVPAEAATGRAWSAMEGSSHGTERSSLDTAHWSTLARFAISLSALSDLPSSLPTVAARRVVNRSIDLLAQDLRDRGKLDLSETFIDASFSSAKKGALLSARLAGEKAPRSWRSSTAMVFLSPSASPALRRMKQNSWKPPWSSDSSQKHRSE